MVNISPAAEVLSNGITDITINIDMNNEQIGSAISQPNCCISNDETITPTLPIVSAKMCRNTPIKVGGALQLLIVIKY